MDTNLVLVIILILGIIVKNDSLIFSAAVLLGTRIFKLDGLLDLIDNYSVKLGIVLIMLGVLSPLATEELKIEGGLTSLLEPLAIVGIIMGIAVTQFTREGIWLMETDPTVTVNLVLGIIFGVAFFNGLPSGPLIASGITAVLYRLFA
ncbi:DUF441 domain-containing protein [Natroniella acetigena]|uniref:DUF441 domain-containing protein n=1 Tax=Natroniella acetigena TaxID=52004 RepID=UPI00200A5419|nr:DUF441 domain-containing protein [Natroniella acetigena]MCK8828446.1 DUF441 domain-containing protein [Natroniella acetigena]